MFGPHNDSHFINIMCSCRRCGVVPDRQHLVCVCVYAYISKQCVCVLVCVLTLAIDRESDWSVNKFVDVIILYLFSFHFGTFSSFSFYHREEPQSLKRDQSQGKFYLKWLILFQTCMTFLSFMEQKKRCLEECSCCNFPYNESEW